MNILGQIWLENMLNCSQFADNDSKIWKIKKNGLGMHSVFKYNVFKLFSGVFVGFLVIEKLQNILKKKTCKTLHDGLTSGMLWLSFWIKISVFRF